VLSRGNTWTAGIPGFGENAFRALFGEYRLEGPAFGDSSPGMFFTVRLCRDPLLFDSSWQGRTVGDHEAFQRREENRLLEALILEENFRGRWTVLFEYPPELETSLGRPLMDKLFGSLSSRISYFISLARTPGDYSLPGAINF
jgi:hypothetical protein